MKKVGIAVIGCGAITLRRHAPEIVSDERCTLTGVYDLRPERANAIAEQFRCRVYGSETEALQDPAVGAVYVCTANTDHARVAVAALNAGKHVMCEKPMAVSVAECREMLAASRRAGKLLMVGHDMRFDPANVLAHELLASGSLGRVITIRSSVKHAGPDNWSLDKSRNTWFFRKEAAAFGAMGDVGVHKLDLIRFLLDDDIAALSAMTGTLEKTDGDGAPITVEDNAVCIFTTQRGVQGVMEASWCNYGQADMSTDVLCEKGRLKIRMDGEYPVVVEWKDGTLSCLKPPESTGSGVTAHFLDSLLDGAPNPNLGESGGRTVAAVVACMASATARAWVTVDNNLLEGGACG